MATVRSIEHRIGRVEGFNVRILYDAGEDVRSDRAGLPGYPYDRMLKNSANVHHWIETRSRHAYPGFDVEVLDAHGRRVHGRTKLATVPRHLPRLRVAAWPAMAVPQAEQLRVELDPAPILIAHAQHRRRFATEVASLDEHALATPSRCHKWSVADIMRHLNDVDGWMWDIWAGRQPPLDSFDPNTTPHEFVVKGRSIPDVTVRDRFVESSDRMAADMESSKPERWGGFGISPLGVVPWWLSAMHIFFDSWLHERDCLLPLGVDVPIIESEATPVLAYILGLVGLFDAEPLDVEVDGIRVRAGTPPVVVTPVGAPSDAVDVAALNDALSGRGEVEAVLKAANPEAASRLGALARFLEPAAS